MGRPTGTWTVGLPPIRQDDDDYLEREYHPTLVAELRAAGGSWYAGDHYAKPAAIVVAAKDRGVTALRLDVRDLSLLHELPGIRHLDVCSDGRPVLDPIASLTHLRSLDLSVSALRGDLDPLAFPDLRWLTIPLGGKGGAAILPSIRRGHPRLEHLRVRETKVKSIGELVATFPRLQSFSLSYADFVRSPGDLTPVAGTLRELRLRMVPGFRSLDGIEVLTRLESLTMDAHRLSDLRPLRALANLRHVELRLADGVRITDVRDLG